MDSSRKFSIDRNTADNLWYLMDFIQGVSWIIHGVSLLFIENRTTSVSIGSGLIIASGCSIIGLGLAMLLPLMVEVDWMLRMAGIFYSLAFFVWIFVILKLAPIITRGLLIGVVFCIIAVGYALVCNVLLVISALVPNVSHITAHWEKAIKAIGYIVSGSAVVGWTLFVMRKTAPTNFKILVPVFIILGIIYIAFGIVMITVLTFR